MWTIPAWWPLFRMLDYAVASTTFLPLIDRVEAITDDLKEVTSSAQAAIDRIEGAVDSAADVIEGPGTDAVSDFRIVAQDLRVLIARLNRLTREIEQNPQSLLRSDPLPYERDGE